MTTHPLVGFLLVAFSGCLFACDHPATHSTQPDLGSSPSGVTNAQARADVDDLANARCDRETSCNNVGAGKKYVSRDVCLDQMRGSLGNDLNPQNCPAGIDRARLDGCLAAIRAEQCDRPLDTLARLQECRTGGMCLK